MLVIGLTGGLAAGKSTAAGFFAAAGVPVFDADACVHRLYAGDAVRAVGEAFPEAVVAGAVDRRILGERVAGDPAALARLEAIVHPLVRREEAAFLARARQAGAAAALVDVPLLLETGGPVDVVVLARCPEEMRRARAGERGMSAESYAALTARQLPDAERLRRSHFIVETGRGLDVARRAVGAILRALAARRVGGGGAPV